MFSCFWDAAIGKLLIQNPVNTNTVEDTTERIITRVTGTLPSFENTAEIQNHIGFVLFNAVFDLQENFIGYNPIALAIDFGNETNIELSEEAQENLRLIAEITRRERRNGIFFIIIHGTINQEIAITRIEQLIIFLLERGVEPGQIRIERDIEPEQRTEEIIENRYF